MTMLMQCNFGALSRSSLRGWWVYFGALFRCGLKELIRNWDWFRSVSRSSFIWDRFTNFSSFVFGGWNFRIRLSTWNVKTYDLLLFRVLSTILWTAFVCLIVPFD